MDQLTQPAEKTVTRLLCPKCSSPKMKAIPFGHVSIILGCMDCKHTYQVDFDIPDEEPAQQPAQQSPAPSPSKNETPEAYNGPYDDPPGTQDQPDELDPFEDDQDGVDEADSQDYPDDLDYPEPSEDDQDEFQPGMLGDDDDDMGAHTVPVPEPSQEAQEGDQDAPGQLEPAEGSPDESDAPDGTDGDGTGQPDSSEPSVITVDGPMIEGDSSEGGGGGDCDSADQPDQTVAAMAGNSPGAEITDEAPDAPTVRLEAGANAELVNFKLKKEKIGSADNRKLAPGQIQDMRVRTFCRKVGEVIADNANDRWVGGKRQGKLWERNLYKVHTGSDRVFSQRQAKKNKAYNVCIVIDCSGSMSGWINRVARMASILVDGLTQHGIRFSVVCFSSRAAIVKDWGDDYDGQQVQDRIKWWFESNASDTGTFGAIIKAEELLRQQLEGHNMLVLITDGRPSTGNNITDPRTGKRYSSGTGLDHATGRVTLVERCQHIQKRLADVIGIGIAHHKLEQHIQKYIPNSETVTNEQEFMDTMLKRFSKLVVRG